MRHSTTHHKLAIALVALAMTLGPLVTPSRSVLAGGDEPAGTALTDVGNTVYLPNVTKMLGGDDGWQTPFIVQNVGGTTTAVSVEFFEFSRGTLARTRTVASLAPGNSFFHDPNSDPELAPGGQYAVVVRSTASPVVAVVNQHQKVRDQARQEALSYQGLSQGSTTIYAPYFSDQVDGWLTTLIVQNLGRSATLARILFRSVDGTRAVGIVRSIQPGRSAAIDPRFETILERGIEYAVTITATEPLGAVINAHNDDASVPTPRGFSYNASLPNDHPSNFMPYVAKNVEGRSTRLFVQNSATYDLQPTLLLCPINTATCAGGANAAAPLPIPAGGVWVLDLNATNIANGEYSVWSFSEGETDNYVSMVATTTGPVTALGHSAPGRHTRWYLPNVTRALGGPSGWTTPIIIQSTALAVTTARLTWYRFADGVLVHRHTVTGLQGATAVRVDPRAIPALSDDTQYAVVVESPSFGVSVVVTELSGTGGDAAMSYEAFRQPRDTSFGRTGCTPSSAHVGSTVYCIFYGLPPGASPVTFTRTHPTAGTTTGEGTPAAADGSTTADYVLTTPGTWTVSAAAGGVTATASFTLMPARFTVTATQSRNGTISVRTLPDLACAMWVVGPDGRVADVFFRRNVMTAFSSATGDATFSYAPYSSPAGNWLNVVRCTSGSETIGVTAPFTVP